MVAKVYGPTGHDDCAAEHAMSRVAHTAGVQTPEPLGWTSHPKGVVGWWEYVDAPGPVCDTIALMQVLRRLHDTAQPGPLVPSLTPVGECGHVDAGLARACEPFAARARTKFAEVCRGVPFVVVHGDPNPTNTLSAASGAVLVDWGSAGLAPRAWDVAVAAQLAVECGQSADAAKEAYGLHADVTGDLVDQLRFVVAVSRLMACTWRPDWVDEGHRRARCLHDGTEFTFGVGQGPR